MLRHLAPALAVLVLLPGCSSGADSDLEDLFGCRISDIAVAQSISGSLTSSDCTLDEILDGEVGADTEYVDLYTFEVDGTQTIQVDMGSSDFDTYLYLYTDAGRFVSDDDDGGAGFNSRLVRSVDPGSYVVVATSFSVGSVGAYTVRLDLPEAQLSGTPAETSAQRGPAPKAAK